MAGDRVSLAYKTTAHLQVQGKPATAQMKDVHCKSKNIDKCVIKLGS